MCVCVLVAQSCSTICNPMDCSPPGSFVHGILQARIVEWFAISFSRGSSWPGNWTRVFYLAGGFFTTEPPEEIALMFTKKYLWLTMPPDLLTGHQLYCVTMTNEMPGWSQPLPKSIPHSCPAECLWLHHPCLPSSLKHLANTPATGNKVDIYHFLKLSMKLWHKAKSRCSSYTCFLALTPLQTIHACSVTSAVSHSLQLCGL